MPMWKVSSPKYDPITNLYNWVIIKIKGKRVVDGPEEVSYHFCGNEGMTGRISTEIKSFDKEGMSGTTRSGRIYMLHGISQMDGDSEYVYHNAMKLWGVPDGAHEVLNDVEELCQSLTKSTEKT